MKRRLRLSALARQDLSETSKYLEEVNPAAAADWLDQISQALATLQSQPFIGKTRDELTHGLRSVLSGKHVILYRVTVDSLDVVRILDGRRDYGRYFTN